MTMYANINGKDVLLSSSEETAILAAQAVSQAAQAAAVAAAAIQTSYKNAINAGLALTSTGTPAIDGIYSITPADTVNIQAVALYIQVNGKFPAGQTAFPVKQLNGSFVSFPTTASYLAFATASADYVTHLNLTLNAYEAGQTPPWPSNAVTIA